MSKQRIYILGGHQSDFSVNQLRQGASLAQLFTDTVRIGLNACQLEPADIEVGHVGNFEASLFCGQSHLGGFFGHVDPAMANMPAMRHEAACASGSMALLAAMADLEAGRYQVACVLGLEIMRNVSGEQAAANLRGAAWADKEWQQTPYVWPCAFDSMIDLYDARYGLNMSHLGAISELNYNNARKNPNAQTRAWQFSENSFSDDEHLNPTISGRIRRNDCGQISDGAAVLFLATQQAACEYAKRHGVDLDSIPYIKGWGHINAPILFEEKLRLAQSQKTQPTHLFPHVQQLFKQTLNRAGMQSIEQLDGLEVHDCFNITEYMILDHSGLYPPGQAWRAVESGDIAPDGRLPVNMSGGLIGLGHPVGATGVRMALDCYKQVSNKAGDYQIEEARDLMTFNLGGSTTTCASLIIGL